MNTATPAPASAVAEQRIACLSVCADPRYFKAAAAFVLEVAHTIDFEASTVQPLSALLEAILQNIVEYGYESRSEESVDVIVSRRAHLFLGGLARDHARAAGLAVCYFEREGIAAILDPLGIRRELAPADGDALTGLPAHGRLSVALTPGLNLAQSPLPSGDRTRLRPFTVTCGPFAGTGSRSFSSTCRLHSRRPRP